MDYIWILIIGTAAALVLVSFGVFLGVYLGYTGAVSPDDIKEKAKRIKDKVSPKGKTVVFKSDYERVEKRREDERRDVPDFIMRKGDNEAK